MTSLYLGIDNGLTGALVALGTIAGTAPVAMTSMPVQGKSKGMEVDPAALWDWIRTLGNLDRLTCVLETPGKHSPGTNALCSMWDSYGVVRGVLTAKGIRLVRVAPQTWQAKMLPGCGKGDTKPFAATVARQLWPAETWLRTPKCTTLDTGLIDAALIAEYARRASL